MFVTQNAKPPHTGGHCRSPSSCIHLELGLCTGAAFVEADVCQCVLCNVPLEILESLNEWGIDTQWELPAHSSSLKSLSQFQVTRLFLVCNSVCVCAYRHDVHAYVSCFLSSVSLFPLVFHQSPQLSLFPCLSYSLLFFVPSLSRNLSSPLHC